MMAYAPQNDNGRSHREAVASDDQTKRRVHYRYKGWGKKHGKGRGAKLASLMAKNRSAAKRPSVRVHHEYEV